MKRNLWEAARWLPVLAALILLLSLGANNKQSSTPLETVEQAVTASVDLSQTQPGDNQMVKRLYGLQPSEFDGCVLCYPVSNMDAEELLIVRLRDVSQQQAVLDAIEARLQTQKTSFDGYGIEQYDLLTNHAVIEVRGNYILFVVSENAEAARQAFLRVI